MFEVIDELMMETLRAPSRDEASIRSPYEKDRKKRVLGRTKEERDVKLKQIAEAREKARTDMIINRSIVKDKVDPREKDLTKTRADLGYKNPSESIEEQIKWALLREDYEDPVIQIKD
jgi:LPS O-antigen subunit length determinant protein (WzzB/FepE family)